MQLDWKPTIERIISVYEGNYGWDKADPGGPTKFGITCYDLAEHRHQKMLSMSAWAPLVRAMSLDEADDIYQTKYAVQCDFADLNAGPDAAVVDFGINSGSSRAIKFSQQIVGVGVDGELGPITLHAINNQDPIKFVNALCDARMNFLRRLPIWGTFNRGWTARVKDLRVWCGELAAEARKPHGLMATHKEETYTEKSRRIHMAFGKAYDKNDVIELKARHADEQQRSN